MTRDGSLVTLSLFVRFVFGGCDTLGVGYAVFKFYASGFEHLAYGAYLISLLDQPGKYGLYCLTRGLMDIMHKNDTAVSSLSLYFLHDELGAVGLCLIFPVK